MSSGSYTMVRALVDLDLAEQARKRAETEGKTLAEAMAELLAAYAKGKPKPRKKKTA